MKRIAALVHLALTWSLLPTVAHAAESLNPLNEILQSSHPAISKVMNNLRQHEVQIIFSQIHQHAGNTESKFTDYAFGLDKDSYFYPASTVKLPVALLAAEYIATQPSLNIDTPYTIEGDTRTHTVAGDIREILLVSDDDAYNRLYELLGRDYINSNLRAKGFESTRIVHRLGAQNAALPGRRKLVFDDNQKLEDYSLNADSAIQALDIAGLKKGVGFVENGVVKKQAFDFSHKNYLPLEELHEVMKRLFFTSAYSEQQAFILAKADQELITTSMASLPREGGYDPSEYYDSYGKFFIFGDSKEPMPKHIKIFNKVGYAYGTLTDSALIINHKTGVKFLLSATILVNKNGVFNDDNYQYESVGIPFLAQLGREIMHSEFIKLGKDMPKP